MTRNFFILCGLFCTSLSSQAFLTDMNVHAAPAPPPSLPSAGSKTIDPIFGSTIMRLTDSRDSSSICDNGYSNQPALNLNNTKIRAVCTVGYSRLKIWDFNASSMALSNGRIQANPPAGLQEYGAQWSRTSNNKYFAVGNKILYEITIPDGTNTTYTNTIIRDFAANFTGTYITQMSVSDNDDVFAFHYVNNGVANGYMVYKRSTNAILLNVSNEGTINEVEIDKSGRYLVALKNNNDLDVWDLQSGPLSTQISSQNFFNHRAIGNRLVVAACTSERLCTRNLATPNTLTFLLPAGSWSYTTQQDHFSLSSTSDLWMTSSRYSINGGPVMRAFDNEIVQVALTVLIACAELLTIIAWL